MNAAPNTDSLLGGRHKCSSFYGTAYDEYICAASCLFQRSHLHIAARFASTFHALYPTGERTSFVSYAFILCELDSKPCDKAFLPGLLGWLALLDLIRQERSRRLAEQPRLLHVLLQRPTGHYQTSSLEWGVAATWGDAKNTVQFVGQVTSKLQPRR